MFTIQIEENCIILFIVYVFSRFLCLQPDYVLFRHFIHLYIYIPLPGYKKLPIFLLTIFILCDQIIVFGKNINANTIKHHFHHPVSCTCVLARRMHILC